MTPSVDLTPTTFKRLQTHATPLVDTIESVISRLLDAYESKNAAAVAAAGASAGDGDNIRPFNPNTPPSLTHTKVLAVEFCGKSFERGVANWNGLLNAAVREAKDAAKSTAELKKLIIVNFAEGRKEDEGFRFLSDAGLSIQGQDANGAWKAACHVAQQLGRQLKVTFVWRSKEGAAFPGVTGQFSIAGR